MVNSATNVFVLDNTNPKPLRTIAKGIGKVEKFSKNLQKIDTINHKKISIELNRFLLVAKKILNKAKSTNQLSASDAKKLLKPWRKLKFKIQDVASKLNQSVKSNQERFYKSLTNNIILVITIMIISFSVFIIVSIFVTKNISNGLQSFHKGVVNLLSSKNKNSKIELNSKDELGEIAVNFNRYLQSIEDGIAQDVKVITEVLKIAEDVKNGKLNGRVMIQAHNPSINQLVSTLNSMIESLQNIMHQSLEVLKQYQNENFRSKAQNYCGGEIGDLIDGINTLGEKISLMLVNNKTNGLTLQNSSQELLSNVSSLSRSSNAAATSLKQTAAALEEITSTITSSNQNVTQMASYATTVIDAANKGEDLAIRTVASIDEINNEVTAITEAITVIDQIAFQTNILSLNAAVEAATAGEAGKGFAVVAQEVRNLAARSAEAAKEIKKIVEKATDKANSGKSIAQQMIQGYEHLNTNIDKTIVLIKEVEIASKEQQAGIVQINDAINLLDQQTQQNAIIANRANDIAISTQNIANEIVEDTDKKEFIGKNEHL